MGRKKFVNELISSVNKSKSSEAKSHLASDDLGYDLDLKDAVSTGIPILDFYMGGGLYPGRVYELFGEESHGKSTLSYHWMASLEQDWDGVTILAESESALDKERAHLIGADPNNIITFIPEHVEDAFKTIGQYLSKIKKSQQKNKERFPVGIFWDTIAAAPTSTEVEHAEGEGDKWGGGHAEKPRLIREWLRSVTKVLPDSNSFIVLVNQVYEKTGGYGKQLVSPGGRGIRHHTSARVFVSRKNAIINEDSQVVGFTVEVKIIKCKQAPTDGKTFKVDLYFASGYDPLSSIVHYVVDHKLVDVTGNGWITAYVGDDEIKAHGVPKFTQEVKNNERLKKGLEFTAASHIAQTSPVIRKRFYNYLADLAKEVGAKPPLEEKWDVYAREFKFYMSKQKDRFIAIDDCLDFVLSKRKEIEENDFTLAQRNKFLEKHFNSEE